MFSYSGPARLIYADGNAGAIVTTRERAREVATDKGIEVEILGFGMARVEPGYTEPVTALYEEQGWIDKFPQGVIDQITTSLERLRSEDLASVLRRERRLSARELIELVQQASSALDEEQKVSLDYLERTSRRLKDQGVATFAAFEGTATGDVVARPPVPESLRTRFPGTEELSGAEQHGVDAASNDGRKARRKKFGIVRSSEQ